MSINTHPISMNGRPKMNGTSGSVTQFRTIKHTIKTSDPTCTNTSSTTLNGLESNISSICRMIVVVFGLTNPKF